MQLSLDSFIKEHPSFRFASDFNDICKPLFKLGIDYFSHVRINDKNEMTANASNPEYYRFYMENQFDQADLHNANPEFPQRYVLWDLVERKGKAEELYRAGIEFGLFHIFTIVDITLASNS